VERVRGGEGGEAEVGEVEGGNCGVVVVGGAGLVGRGRGGGRAGEGEQDVFGLEVAVRELVRVQGGDGREELMQEGQRVRFGERAVGADVAV